MEKKKSQGNTRQQRQMFLRSLRVPRNGGICGASSWDSAGTGNATGCQLSGVGTNAPISKPSALGGKHHVFHEIRNLLKLEHSPAKSVLFLEHEVLVHRGNRDRCQRGRALAGHIRESRSERLSPDKWPAAPCPLINMGVHVRFPELCPRVSEHPRFPW